MPTTTSQPAVDPRTQSKPLVPLEAVISTAELAWRPTRPPDYRAESQALVELAEHMARTPQEILQRLVETALKLCHAGSAGVSIIEDEHGLEIFRWHALTGALATHLWGTTPRYFSPCGTVVDTNAIQKMSNLELHYRYFAEVKPTVVEALLIPFTVEGKTVGTIWVVTHDSTHQFDAEDARLIADLGKFASAAYQARTSAARLGTAFNGDRDAPFSVAAVDLKKRLREVLDFQSQTIDERSRRDLLALACTVDGFVGPEGNRHDDGERH